MKIEIKEATPVARHQMFEGREVVLAHVHTDARRTIYEGDLGDGRVMTYFVVHASDLPLGKHYHAIKTETFTILSGEGEVLTCPVHSDGEAADIFSRRWLNAGDEVVMVPMVAHTFYLDPGATMLCVSSHPFDQDDMIATNWLVK